MFKKVKLLSILLASMSIASVAGIQGVHAAEHTGVSIETLKFSDGSDGVMETTFVDGQFNGSFELSDGRKGSISGKDGQGYANLSDGSTGYVSISEGDTDERSSINVGDLSGNGRGAYCTENGWTNANGYWYYLDNNGFANGWLQVNGTWYYFNSDGAMATGWLQVNGSWYYFNSSGAMASSTYVGGYYVGSDGAWVA